MKIKPFEVVFPDFNVFDSPDHLSNNAKFLFRNHFDAGLYRRHNQAAFYIYQIEVRGRKHIGLVALNDVEDFFDGKVVQHEHTLSDKERQHLDLILGWQAVLKPVLLTYREVPEICSWLTEYVKHHHALFSTRFERGSQVHKIWQVSHPDAIQALQTLFAKHLHRVYIADGHHRTTTMAILHEQREQYPDLDLDHLFCAFFADQQLDILDYNRVVEALDHQSPLHFLASLSAVFDIEPMTEPGKPARKHEIVLFLRKEWFRLRWRPEVLKNRPKETVQFDASLLNELVLRDIMGITDVRSDSRITYIEGSKGLKGIEKACKSGLSHVGFVLYPVAFEDLVNVADAGDSLPPKSTYFEPRLKSGILVHVLRK